MKSSKLSLWISAETDQALADLVELEKQKTGIRNKKTSKQDLVRDAISKFLDHKYQMSTNFAGGDN